MRLRIFFIAILWVFLSATYVAGQTQGTINYILTIKDGLPGSPRTINYTLSFSGNRSIVFPEKKTSDTSSHQISETALLKVVSSGNRIPFIYKDLAKKELLLSDDIWVRNYLITDTLHNFEWKITNEQTKILNYNCTKAITSFRGREYEAWFTEEIALPHGPWKFGGLPGLIIKVRDHEGVYEYELSGLDLKVKFDAELINLPVAYVKDSPLSYKEFRKLFDTKKEELKAKSRIVTYGPNYTSTTTTQLPEKMELF